MFAPVHVAHLLRHKAPSIRPKSHFRMPSPAPGNHKSIQHLDSLPAHGEVLFAVAPAFALLSPAANHECRSTNPTTEPISPPQHTHQTAPPPPGPPGLPGYSHSPSCWVHVILGVGWEGTRVVPSDLPRDNMKSGKCALPSHQLDAHARLKTPRQDRKAGCASTARTSLTSRWVKKRAVGQLGSRFETKPSIPVTMKLPSAYSHERAPPVVHGHTPAPFTFTLSVYLARRPAKSSWAHTALPRLHHSDHLMAKPRGTLHHREDLSTKRNRHRPPWIPWVCPVRRRAGKKGDLFPSGATDN